jgi:Ca-activated chloride channel family protein
MFMRRTLTGLFAAFLILALPLSESAQQQQEQQQPQPPPPDQNPQKSQTTITSVVNLVDVLATVLNRRNKLVPDLTQDDFKLSDDNVAQTIKYFSKQSDIPLRIGLLLDTSNSIRDRIKFEQDAAVNFLYTVLRRGKDQAFAMTFDDEPQMVQGFTGDTGLLRDQIVKTKAGGGTAVYDAIYEACAKHLSNPPRPAGDQPDVVRRVMILISDGEDNLSDHTRSEAVEMAQRTGVVIYTISTSIQWVTTTAEKDCRATGSCKYHLTDGDKILQQLAEETGGRSFYPYHVDDLDQSFQDIGDELRNQYQITYNPSNFVANNKYHRIKIELPKFNGYQVRARKGYYARANGTGPTAPAPATPPAATPPATNPPSPK